MPSKRSPLVDRDLLVSCRGVKVGLGPVDYRVPFQTDVKQVSWVRTPKCPEGSLPSDEEPKQAAELCMRDRLSTIDRGVRQPKQALRKESLCLNSINPRYTKTLSICSGLVRLARPNKKSRHKELLSCCIL